VSFENCDVGKYIAELCSDIIKSTQGKKTHIVQTIYFGGGTPSFIDAKYIADILQSIRDTFTVSPDAEISIECNPNSIIRDKLETYKNIGINRISIGVQSFSNRMLKILGRVHNVNQAKDAIKLACSYFNNVNIDLMHSVPKNPRSSGTPFTKGGIIKLPRRYLRMVQHVSAYCLTSDKFAQVDERQSIKEQLKVEKILAKLGYKKYEVSNFARTSFECKHNLVYWQCGEWLGFGTSAASHFNEPWSNNDRIMLGLRLTEGIDEKLVANKTDVVMRLESLGLVTCNNGRLACTDKGFLILNEIIRQLTD